MKRERERTGKERNFRRIERVNLLKKRNTTMETAMQRPRRRASKRKVLREPAGGL